MASTKAHFDLSPEGNLGRYLERIRSYPMLTPDEEAILSRRWRDTKDAAAAERLVTSHLRLVAKIARGYRGYGLPLAEIIAEGNVGLMQAVDRFDPERGFRFATYAMWWIRAAIQEYVLRSWSLVKIGTTAAQKKLFFNLRRLKGQMRAFEEGDLAPDQVTEVAERLNVSEHEVINMNRRLTGPDRSLNVPMREDGDGEWQDWLVSNDERQDVQIGEAEELHNRRGLLARALKVLSDRERRIIQARRLKERPATLQHLSLQFGISRERVRQIEVQAFQKLRKAVRNAVMDQRLTV